MLRPALLLSRVFTPATSSGIARTRGAAPFSRLVHSHNEINMGDAETDKKLPNLSPDIGTRIAVAASKYNFQDCMKEYNEAKATKALLSIPTYLQLLDVSTASAFKSKTSEIEPAWSILQDMLTVHPTPPITAFVHMSKVCKSRLQRVACCEYQYLFFNYLFFIISCFPHLCCCCCCCFPMLSLF